jgi:hypothetical protein
VRDPLKRYIGRQIAVHDLHGGPSFQGVLMEAFPATILLRAVRNLDEEADLQGEVGLPRQNAWWQVIA